jgi:hypothetical protein
MKHVISTEKSKPDQALSLIKDDFFDNIKNIILEHQQWHKDRKVSSCLLVPYPCIGYECLDMSDNIERPHSLVAVFLWNEDRRVYLSNYDLVIW